MRWYSLDVTSLPIFITPIFSLFVMALANRWLQAWRPRWSLKMLLIRFGGMYAHRFGFPFALGLILGDFTMGSLWSLITIVFQVPTYRIYI